MSGSIHQTVSSATFLKSIQYHLCVGCHPRQQSGHLSLKQILLENKVHGRMEERRKDAGHKVFLVSLNLFSWYKGGVTAQSVFD